MLRKVNIHSGMLFYYKLVDMAKFVPELTLDREKGLIYWTASKKPKLLCDIMAGNHVKHIRVEEAVYANVMKQYTQRQILRMPADREVIMVIAAGIRLGVPPHERFVK